MQYRSEIDGLRAVAVLVVMLFHAGFATFSGGFVGVDVFFVISGYLITNIIIEQKAKGSFSLLHFYERRARRILPVLFLVCAVASVFAWFWLLPSDYKSFFKSLSFVSFFSSNIYFLRESGYFDTAAELKPLLHTWSLSVEEQFYVFYPLIIICLWRFGLLKIQLFIFSLLLVSFLYADKISSTQASSNFFLIYSRCWELCIGALLALFQQQSKGTYNLNQLINNIFSALGILFIFLAVFTLNENTPFPSKYALLPTLGAALVIGFANKQTWVGRFLSIKPLVLLGLISYGAYLWHQPIFAFARHRAILNPSPLFMFFLILLAFLIAYFSWRFVEQPFRDAKRFTQRQILSIAIFGLLIMGSFSMYAQNYEVNEVRISPKIVQFISAKGDRANTPNDCFLQSLYNEHTCILGNKLNVVGALIGDSHALSISHSLAKQLNQVGIGFKFLASSGCPPALNVYRVNHDEGCPSFNQSNIDYILKSNNIEYVILVSRWTLNLESNRFDNLEGGREFKSTKVMDILVDGKKITSTSEDIRKNNIAKQYQNTIQLLLNNNKKVILVYPIPELGWNLPTYAAKLLLYQENNQDIKAINNMLLAKTSTSHALFVKRNARTHQALNAIGNHQHLFRIYPEQLFCNTSLSQRCISLTGNKLFYYDDNHLTNTGADLVTQQIMAYLNNKVN